MDEQPVWFWPEGSEAPVLAGHLKDLGAGTAFRYASDFVRRPDARPLDRGQLRHFRADAPRVIPSTAREGLPGIIADAGPDSWGRMLLAQTLRFTPTALEALVHSADDGVGNLAVGDLTLKPNALARDLDELAEAVARRQSGEAVPAELAQALSPDTALGGAKPKASVEVDGALWLAKFPERGDTPALPFLEAAAMSLAGRLGLRVAEARPVTLAKGYAALLVRRFDRRQQDGRRTRLGFASALTVMGPRGELIGAPERSYLHLARSLAQWCPAEALASELRELWRRIAFNGLIGNRDDHPRNHGLLCEGGTWRLSPAFDLVPACHPTEQLSLSLPFIVVDGQRSSLVTAQRLIQAAPTFGVSTEEAHADLRAMLDTMRTVWPAMPSELGAPASAQAVFLHALAWADRLRQSLDACSSADLEPPKRASGRGWRSNRRLLGQ
ncbi:MAG: HipA domain-containing protein [Rhodocyclales bacterium]|nr:HipA domain-containing protein [Rhodocyclales bacterium]